MTEPAVLEAVPGEPLRPLTELLAAQAARYDGVLGVVPSLLAAGPGWIPAADLARPPYRELRRLIEATAARYRAPVHVGASLLWKAYAYWHVLPMATGWALNRRVPLMRLADTRVRESAAGVTLAATRITVAVLPDDPCAGAPGTVVTTDLAAAVREALLDGQLPLVRAIGALTRLGARNLWGSTAEAFAGPLLDQGLRYADLAGLLAAIGEPVAGLLALGPDGYRRATCCLWVTLPGEEPCPTCCVRRPRRHP